MGIQLADQTISFLYAIVVGAALGLVYDIFRISRVAIPTNKAVIFIEDVVFFFFCAAVTFLFLMGSVDGQVRFFLLVGEFIGAVIYYITLGRVVISASSFIIGLIKEFFRMIFRYIMSPVWRVIFFVVTLILRPLRFVGKIVKKTARRLKFSLKVRRIVLYNHIAGYFSSKLGKLTHRKQEEYDFGQDQKEEP